MSNEFKLYADFQRHNFFRTPTWRWERVLAMVDHPGAPRRCTRRDDQFVRRARSFILKWRDRGNPREREELWWEEPGLYYAHDFERRRQQGQPGPALILEARLLAGQDPDDISLATGASPDAVRWFEQLFFNVADFLRHRDWIVQQVLMPAFRRGPGHDLYGRPFTPNVDLDIVRPFLDGSLKLFSYFGGPYVADAVIGGLQAGRPCPSPDDVSGWFDQTWMNIIRRRSAQAAGQFEINKYNVMQLFETHTRIIEIERSAESQESQRTAVDRHIQGLLGSIPWVLGEDGRKLGAGKALGRLDALPAELRDDEVLRIAAGESVPGLEEDFPRRLPPPRPGAAGQTPGHANEL
jgi:hypothetical protein